LTEKTRLGGKTEREEATGFGVVEDRWRQRGDRQGVKINQERKVRAWRNT